MIHGMIFIVNFLFLHGYVPWCPSCGVYISQLIRFAIASSYVSDFSSRGEFLTVNSLSNAIGITNSAKYLMYVNVETIK